MDLYTNPRAWRTRALLYFFLAVAVGFLLFGFAGVVVGNEAMLILGFILGPLALLAVWGMNVLLRHMVVALARDGDRLTVETWTLTGPRREVYPFAGARIGDDVHEQSADDSDDDEGVKLDNHSRRLFVPGRAAAYVVDTTADPQAGQALADAFAATRRPVA
jgi:hypothetical protein